MARSRAGQPKGLDKVRRDETIDIFVQMGIPATVLQGLPELPKDVEGLLVYGSQARGDAVPGSDLDLIALTSSPRPSRQCGDVSISYYTRRQLSTGTSTLFGAHLKRDGKVVWDDSGELTRAIDGMGEVDTSRLLARALSLSELFTSPGYDLPKFLPGLLRQARYLLRSCLYAQAIATGDPCFSVRELAVRHSDPSLTHLLASRHEGKPSIHDYEESQERLAGIIGAFPSSRSGSLEATLVNEWGADTDLLSMAFMALGITGQGSDYAEVEKILL